MSPVPHCLLRLLALAAALLSSVTPSTARDPDELLLVPPPGDGPVEVLLDFTLRDLNEIDDEAETFEFTAVLGLGWDDPRQAFDPDEFGAAEKFYHGDFQFNETAPSWYPQLVLVNESGQFEAQGVVLRVRPDGRCWLTTTVNATAEAELDMRRYPFDRQRLEAAFQVLGHDSRELVLVPGTIRSAEGVSIPQWHTEGIDASLRESPVLIHGADAAASQLTIGIEVRRESFFLIRLVVIPLALIVTLSWSVFWMDRSSLADRLNISFVGILTAVAYQIVLGDLIPHVSYFTLIHGFLNLSFFVMCAGAAANLFIWNLDKRGDLAAGDRLDRRFRRFFPLVYLTLNLVMLGVAFAFF